MKSMKERGVYTYKETVHNTGNAMPDKPKTKNSPGTVKADKSQSGNYRTKGKKTC